MHPGEPLPNTAKLIILPGSKATISDLAALRANGWDIDLYAHARRGEGSMAFVAVIRCLGAL